MAYQVIARKFRPKRFEDVLGQEPITKALRRSVESERTHHAYLFTGARGVGKTSTARILARALCCTKGPSAEPCGECVPCKEIDQGSSLNVREIDGASHNGVDEIRDLREALNYLPTSGRFRIFIIDEVHMLSNSAFNALLKTLEEPPAHIVFIFATTEPHKIPETILSRCQRYDFRLLPHRLVVDQLRSVCTQESVEIEDGALHLLAREAAGSMRDAETLLDQVIAFAGEKVTRDTVTQSLGLIDRALLRKALHALLHREASSLLATVQTLADYGADLKHFTQDLLFGLRNLSLLQACGEEQGKRLLDLADDEVEHLKELAALHPLEETERLFHLLQRDLPQIAHAPLPRIALEMSLLRLLQTPPLVAISELLEEVRALARGQGAVAPSPSAAARLASAPASAAALRNTAPAEPAPRASAATPLANASDAWTALIQAVRSKKPSVATGLLDAEVVQANSREIILAIAENSYLQSLFHDPETRVVLLDAARTLFGQEPTLEIRKQAGGKTVKSAGQEKAEERKRLSEVVKDHPVVREMQNILGAEIHDVKSLGKDS